MPGAANSAAISGRLNAEGFRPPKRLDRNTGQLVQRLKLQLGLARRERHGSQTGLKGDEFRPTGVLRQLAISRDMSRRWLRARWLTMRRDEDDYHAIRADASELRRLREFRHLSRAFANKDRLARLQVPKPRPER